MTARDYAYQYAGRLLEAVPLSGLPFRVVVVGAYFDSILVVPEDENTVPETLRGALDDQDAYSASNYVKFRPGRVMAVPRAQLREPGAPRPYRNDRYPHRCSCGSSAYIGVVPAAFECLAGCHLRR